jgi:hypothetical protein
MHLNAKRRIQYERPIQELLFSPWILVPCAALFGWLIATQFFELSPRYLKLLVGVSVLFAVTRFPLYLSVVLFMLIFPVPTFIFIGDTNVLIIGLLSVVWIAEMGLRRMPHPVRTPINWTILIYLGVHVLSFINVDTAAKVEGGVRVMTFMIAGAVLYWIMVNAIRTETHLRYVLQALCVTALFVDITGLVEHFFHGYKLVPDWFLYRGGMADLTGERIGGVFGFHALLADWCAILFYLQIMLGMRTRRRLAKFYYYGLAGLGLVVLSLTVNRGGAVIWVLGGLYFFGLMRSQIRWVRVIIGAPIVVGALLVSDLLGGQWLTRLRLVGRLASTQFQRGIPDTRVWVWAQVMKRIPEHLWLGHGPYYQLGGYGTSRVVWPHSAYLFYLHSTGVAGLSVFLWMLGKMIWKSFPASRVDFTHWSLARATQALVHIQLVMFAMAQIRTSHQRGNVYVYFMWILLALAAITIRLAKESRSREETESQAETSQEPRRVVSPYQQRPRRVVSPYRLR